MAEASPSAETPKTEDQPKKSKGLPTIAKVGIGCFVLLFIIGAVITVVGGWLAKKAGTSILEKAIESKTGVKTNLSDIEKGKMSFTDTKTGQSVQVGTGKIPDNFPKDFPVYPGAKVTSSLSGSDKGLKNGFWLTLSSTDTLDTVSSYYKSNLKTNGWTVKTTLETTSNVTLGISKNTMEGTVTIDRSGDVKETTILIILGEGTGTSQPTPTP